MDFWLQLTKGLTVIYPLNKTIEQLLYSDLILSTLEVHVFLQCSVLIFKMLLPQTHIFGS